MPHDAAPETRFDRDTALVALGPGRFAAELSADWWAVVGPNGGYLAAIALRAMLLACAQAERRPRSLHLRYLSSARPGAAEVQVATLRAGRTVSVLTARITQGESVLVEASAALGVPASKIAYCDARMPELPAREACTPFPKHLPINERYELWRGLGGEFRKSERALSGGWIRLEEPRLPDALLLSAVWDAWAPAPLYRRLDERCTGAAPTIEASLYFRSLLPLPSCTPESYLALRVESMMAAEGYFEESAEIWSPCGQLLVQSRQLALIY